MEAPDTKEQQVVELHLKNPDLTLREIGERLGIREWTVSDALTRYYARQRQAGQEAGFIRPSHRDGGVTSVGT